MKNEDTWKNFQVTFVCLLLNSALNAFAALIFSGTMFALNSNNTAFIQGFMWKVSGALVLLCAIGQVSIAVFSQMAVVMVGIWIKKKTKIKMEEEENVADNMRR